MKKIFKKILHPWGVKAHTLSFRAPTRNLYRSRIKYGMTVVAGMTILLFSIFYFFPKKAEASWFDESWLYRVALTIVNSGAADTNKKVKFDIATDALITAGKMQSDCGDSRFTDASGKLLQYFIDTAGGACNSASTDYYVLVPVINNGSTTIYHYYGNPSAENGTEPAQFSQATFTQDSTTTNTEETGPGPVLYWKFDDGQGTSAFDSSSSNLTGTLNNTPAWQTEDQCVAGKCLWFSGTANMNVSKADDDKLDFGTGSFSVSTWVKKNGASSANNVILTKSTANIGSTYTGYKVYMDASGDLCFDTQDGTNAVDTACTSAVDFDDNLWHYVTGVKSGTTSLTLYVDGKSRATDSSIASNLTLSNASTFYVGVDSDGTTTEWLGFIDEVKVYPYARSAAQVKADYVARGTKQGSSAVIASDAKQSLSQGLVGYWKMDESSGNATDSSGNSTTLTNTDTATFSSGKYGNGTVLNGTSQYFVASDNTALSVTGDLTLSSWIKPSANTAATQYNIEGKWDGSNTSYLLAQYETEIRLYLNSASNYVTTSGAGLTTGTWYQILATYSQKDRSVKIYVNGEEKTTTTTGTIPASITDDTSQFFVGADSTSALNLQPNGTDGIDTFIFSASPDNNLGVHGWVYAGERNDQVDTRRTLIKFDLSTIPDNAVITSSTLSLSVDADISSNARTFRVYRQKRAWVEGTKNNTNPADGASWNTYDGTHAWQTAGGFGSDDSEQTDIGSSALTSNETANTWKDFVLTPTTKAALDLGNGWLIKADTETDDGYVFRSSDYVTDITKRPKLVVTYTDSGASNFFNGSIDEARVYNRALSPKEIRDLYNFAPGPRVLLKAEEGIGTTAFDSSGNGRNGTINGNPVWSTGKYGKGIKMDGTGDNIQIGDF